MEENKRELKKRFKMKDLEEVSTILGIQVNNIENGIIIHQPIYIDECLERFGLTNATPVKIPLSTDNKLSEINSQTRILDEHDKNTYQQMIGCLMYLATMTRPDIMYSVALLSRFNVQPNEKHLKAAKQVFRYLKQSKDKG